MVTRAQLTRQHVRADLLFDAALQLGAAGALQRLRHVRHERVVLALLVRVALAEHLLQAGVCEKRKKMSQR